MTSNLGYRLSTEAKADLIEIRRYTLTHFGSHQSEKYLTEFDHILSLLGTLPTMGRKRPELGPDIYSFPHASHVVYYFSNQEQMIVFGVLHKNMVPVAHLHDREVD